MTQIIRPPRAGRWTWFFSSVIALVGAMGEMRLPCPSNDTEITLVYDVFPAMIEVVDASRIPTTLSDLRGFDVNFFAEFFSLCPMPYALKRVPILEQRRFGPDASTSTSYGSTFSSSSSSSSSTSSSSSLSSSDFILMMNFPAVNYTFLHITQPAVIFPSSVVYYRRPDENYSLRILQNYGLAYLFISLLGSCVIVVLTRMESRDGSDRDYATLIWNFCLSPFGLQNESLARTPSLKVFSLSWLMVWFLMTGYFWSDMSSSMTVSKLKTDIDTFEDVLRSDRKFFWKGPVKDMSQTVVRGLKEKYARFAGAEHLAYEEFNASDVAYNAQSAAKLLRRNEVLLAWSADLYYQLDERLRRDPELVIKEDWSVFVTTHYSLSPRRKDILDALNEFIAQRRASGQMEQEMKAWWGLNRAVDGRPEMRPLENFVEQLGPLRIVFVAAMVATVGSLATSLITTYAERKRRRRSSWSMASAADSENEKAKSMDEGVAEGPSSCR